MVAGCGSLSHSPVRVPSRRAVRSFPGPPHCIVSLVLVRRGYGPPPPSHDWGHTSHATAHMPHLYAPPHPQRPSALGSLGPQHGGPATLSRNAPGLASCCGLRRARAGARSCLGRAAFDSALYSTECCPWRRCARYLRSIGLQGRGERGAPMHSIALRRPAPGVRRSGERFVPWVVRLLLLRVRRTRRYSTDSAVLLPRLFTGV